MSDCLETREAIAIENKVAFVQTGGRDFNYSPCLNKRSQWIQTMTQNLREHLSGWLMSEAEAARLNAQAQTGKALALAMGAKR